MRQVCEPLRTRSIAWLARVRFFSDIRDGYEVGGRKVARRVVRTVLRGAHISPNAVTIAGCLLNGVAAVVAFNEQWLYAAVVFMLGSLLDAMDGAVAKVTGRVTAFGAFLDSTLDRVSEGLMLLALGLVFARHHQPWPLAACFVALASSYLVSYTRAKAEALGVQCKGGLASRVERVVVLTIGLAVTQWYEHAIEYVMYVLAVTAALTVLQRVVHVYRSLPDGRKPRRPRREPRRRRRPLGHAAAAEGLAVEAPPEAGLAPTEEETPDE